MVQQSLHMCEEGGGNLTTSTWPVGAAGGGGGSHHAFWKVLLDCLLHIGGQTFRHSQPRLQPKRNAQRQQIQQMTNNIMYNSYEQQYCFMVC